MAKYTGLKNHPYAQCYVLAMNGGTIHFFSYKTRVITITPDGWLCCTGLYSATTRKQIGWFLKEYAPMINYHMVKQVYNDAMMINIHTGEVL